MPVLTHGEAAIWANSDILIPQPRVIGVKGVNAGLIYWRWKIIEAMFYMTCRMVGGKQGVALRDFITISLAKVKVLSFQNSGAAGIVTGRW